MIVNTRRLFLQLLPAMRIGTVCDIGSMDGSDALRFRAALPRANIHAFEPHPGNFERMQRNAQLRESAIRIEPVALSNRDGTADFFLVDAADFDIAGWQGMSSLQPRSRHSQATVRVRTERLDTHLAAQGHVNPPLALWIDTEGKAYEVIEGATGLFRSIDLLHVEVETRKCISDTQEFLYPQVRALLQKHGFAELATDEARTAPQFNALFVRSDLPGLTAWRVKRRLAFALVRAVLGRSLHRSFPRLTEWLRGSRRAGPTAG